MEALRLTFHLGSPVLVDSEYPLHLDALVAFGVMRDAEDLGEADPWAASQDLSACLGQAGAGPDQVWQASRLLFTPHPDAHLFEMQNMVRRTDPGQFYTDLDRGLWAPENPKRFNPETFKIDLQSGQQRIYQWLAASRWMQHATAWAIGDAEALTYYLRHVLHLGKMGRNGYGRVVSIDIQPAAPEEAEHWRLRWLPDSVPGKADIEYAPVNACLRPPYWRRTERQQVREPIL